MPTFDHQIISAGTKTRNWFKATVHKIDALLALIAAVAIFFVALEFYPPVCVVSIAPLILAVLLREDAAKVYGPDFGDATGSGRMGTLEDLKPKMEDMRRKGLVR